MAAGKVHLELLEQYRRLYLKARAVSLAQVLVLSDVLCSKQLNRSSSSRRTWQQGGCSRAGPR
jgi:hypothetical protein